MNREKETLSHTLAWVSGHINELTDLAVLFSFKVDIDELPELMKGVLADKCG